MYDRHIGILKQTTTENFKINQVNAVNFELPLV